MRGSWVLEGYDFGEEYAICSEAKAPFIYMSGGSKSLPRDAKTETCFLSFYDVYPHLPTKFTCVSYLQTLQW